MGAMLDDLGGHEGYALRELADGTLTPTWTPSAAGIDAYRATCQCGWTGTARHQPTEDGYDAALDEWQAEHAAPLLTHVVPDDVRQALTDACRAIRDLLDTRPGAATTLLGDLDRWRQAIARRVEEPAIETKQAESDVQRRPRGRRLSR